MYQIILQRIKEYKGILKPPTHGRVYKKEDSTIGRLKIINTETQEELYKCFSLENRGPSSDEPNRDLRIMPRIYKLYSTPSSVALPKEAQGIAISTYSDEYPAHKARRIHIHIGNYPQDTQGCILLGRIDNKDGTIGKSTDATRGFYDLVNRLGVGSFTLEIVEIKEDK